VGWSAATRTCKAGSADPPRDVRHHLVQQSQAVPITGQPKFVGVRNAALMLVGDHHARRACAQGGTDLVGLVVTDTNDPSVLVEIQVPDPAADMATQIDPAFLHARDRAVIGGTARQRPAHAGAFDQEGGAEASLKHRLHHRAAAEVADTDTENLFHHPTLTRGLMPSSSETGRSQPPQGVDSSPLRFPTPRSNRSSCPGSRRRHSMMVMTSSTLIEVMAVGAVRSGDIVAPMVSRSALMEMT